MGNKLEDRKLSELPLNHPKFEEVRLHSIHTGNETVDDYRKSQDGLLIQVKCYYGCPCDINYGLNPVDNNDPNWIESIIDEFI